MKGLIIILITATFVLSCTNDQISNKKKEAAQSGFDPEVNLVEKTFFNCLVISVPDYKRTNDMKAERKFKIIHFESRDNSVLVTVRKMEMQDLNTVKEIQESMAGKVYHGEIHKSEFRTINGLDVYIVEMTGYWNYSKTKESWLKFFTNYNRHLYQFLIKFPEKDREKTEELRNKIIESVRTVE